MALVKTVTLQLDAETRAAALDIRALSDKLTELDSKVTTARVDLKGNKEAGAELDKLDVKLIRLGKKVASPNITVEGKAGALADIGAVDLAMDRLNKKFAGGSFFKRTSTWGGLGRTLAGVLPGVSSAGGGAAGGTAQAAGGSAGGILSNPYAVTGIAAAALTALPFLAQAAAGAITIGLGGALTGIGILSAAQAKRVKADWTGLFGQTGAELRQVAQPFVGALKQISQVAQSVLPSIMESLVGPMKILAPAFQAFSDALLRTFTQPAVATSLQAVAKAFGDILKALAPQLAGDIKDVATGIERIANSVARNPRAFADFISFLFDAAGFAFSMVSALTNVANYIEKHFIPALGDIRKAWDDARHQTAVILDGMRHDSAHTWDQIFSNTIGTVIRLGHNVETQFDSLRHGIAVTFDGARHDIASAWDSIWSTSIGQVQDGVTKVVIWFNGMPGRILGALRGLGHSLGAFASAALTEMWDGFKAIGGSILSWIGNFVGNIIGDVKKLLHIGSPSGVFYDIGKNMMLGLEGGIKAHARGAARAAQSAIPSGVGGNVGSWIGQSLSINRLPSWWGPLMGILVGKESGGNPKAFNPISVLGQHAEGIAQMLPSTFASYTRGGSIWNPVANLVSAERYIEAVYGNPRNIAGLLGGTYYGYAGGSWKVPYTGPATVHQGEMIIPARAAAAIRSGAGGVINYNLTVTAPVGSNPRDIGRQIVDYVKKFEAGSGAGWRS
jgi:hypothetical protein